jgi:hypothetical protein
MIGEEDGKVNSLNVSFYLAKGGILTLQARAGFP